MARNQRSHSTAFRRLCGEILEPRLQFDNTSAQWANALSLSLSFVPDGTLLGDAQSSLQATLAETAQLSQWKSTIARAFQTWTQYANINLGIVTDEGQPIGAAGALHGDDRFGDIRIAGYPLTVDTMAEAVSQSRTIAGTVAGDIVFNTTSAWPDEATLFSVALHEAGHTLGLTHSTDPNSPMFKHGASQATGPTAEDIANLRTLYGPRRVDAHELGSDNNSISKATRIPFSEPVDGFDGTTPLVVFGDVQNDSDSDVFELPVLSGYSGPLTFELRTRGMSQLHGTFSVTDRFGNILATTLAQGDLGGVYNLHLSAATLGKYYLHVAGTPGDLFASGAFAVVTKYDNLITTTDQQLEAAILKGHRWQANTDDNSAKIDFRKLLLPGITSLDNDSHQDDTSASGKALTPILDTAASRRYQYVGTLSDATDKDFLQIRAQNSPSTTRNLTVALEALEPNAIIPQVRVFDSRDLQLSVTMLANGNGLVMLRVDNIEANKDYFVQISATDGSVGNYVVRAQFEDVALNRHLAYSDSLTSTQGVREAILYVAKPQLMSFALESAKTDGETALEPIWARVFDEFDNTVAFLGTSVGTYRSSNSSSLIPGTYSIRIEGLGADGASGPNANFQFFADAISDPIAAPVLPPDQQPIFEVPGSPGVFVYPGQPPTTDPILVVPDPIIDQPTPNPITPPPDTWFWPSVHAPIALASTTPEDTLSGPVVIIKRNPQDGAKVFRVKISNITGGTLYGNDGLHVIVSGSMLSLTETGKGLRFLPSANSIVDGHFTVESSIDGRTAVANTAAQGTIKVLPVGDLPLLGNVTTLPNTLSSPIVIDPNPNDASVVTAFRIGSIIGGTLFRSDGVTPIVNGGILDATQAHAGVRFLPDSNRTLPGSFVIQAGESPLATAILSPPVTSTITIASQLTLQIHSTAVSENGTVTATIGRGSNASLLQPLTVTLSSSDITIATVPTSVVIPAGLSTIDFAISGVNDAVVDGPQRVTIGATASDSVPVTANIIVTDDNGPSPYHNPRSGLRSDANLDQKDDIQDILIEVFYFNTFTDGVLPSIANLSVPYFAADSTGDNRIDITDILISVYDFNQAAAEGERQGEFNIEKNASTPATPYFGLSDYDLLALLTQDITIPRKAKKGATLL